MWSVRNHYVSVWLSHSCKTAKLQSSIFIFYISGFKYWKTFTIRGAESAARLVPTKTHYTQYIHFQKTSRLIPAIKLQNVTLFFLDSLFQTLLLHRQLFKSSFQTCHLTELYTRKNFWTWRAKKTFLMPRQHVCKSPTFPWKLNKNRNNWMYKWGSKKSPNIQKENGKLPTYWGDNKWLPDKNWY